MTITVTIDGQKELDRLLQRVKKTAPQKLDGIAYAGAELTRETAVNSINTPASQGATYRRGNVTHTASLPGYTPNTDTGDLVRNITTEKVAGGYTTGSRSGAPHGFHLEYGTSKMEPRPWLTPAFKQGVQKVREFIKTLDLFDGR